MGDGIISDTLQALGLSSEKTNEVVEIGGIQPFMIVDTITHKLVSMEALQNEPSRKRVAVQCFDAASFNAYVLEQKTAQTRIFAKLDGEPLKVIVIAAIDYHGTEPTRASWVTHTVTINPSLSDEWKAWMANNNKALPQVDFAEFLEDHQRDVADPDGATLLELVSTLEATREVQVRSSIRLENGDVGFKMDETTRAQAGVSGEMSMPGTMRLDIPVFDGGNAISVDARLRHRLDPVTGKLSFRYLLDRPRDIVRAAAEELITAIEAGTGVPVFRGGYVSRDTLTSSVIVK